MITFGRLNFTLTTVSTIKNTHSPMKQIYLLITALILSVGCGFAQDFEDDIYYNGKKAEKEKKERSVKQATTIAEPAGYTLADTYEIPYDYTWQPSIEAERDVDEYNRRGLSYYEMPVDTIGQGIASSGDFVYTQQIQRFYNPTIVIDSSEVLSDWLADPYGNIDVVYNVGFPTFAYTPSWGWGYNWGWNWTFASPYLSWGIAGPYWGYPYYSYWSPAWYPGSWGWGPGWGWGWTSGCGWGHHHHHCDFAWNGWATSRPRPTSGVRPGWGSNSRPTAARPSTGIRPGTSSRPGVATRPTAGTRPGTSRPNASTRPGAMGSGSRPSASQRPGFDYNYDQHRPGSLPSARPGNGTSRPSSGSVNSRPGTATSRPSSTRPGAGSSVRPGLSTSVGTVGTMPMSGGSTRPSTGTSTRPSTGTSTRPSTGVTSRPSTGSSSRPSTGVSSRPSSGGSSSSRPSNSFNSSSRPSTSSGSVRSSGGGGFSSGRASGGGGGGGRRR